MPKTYIWKVGGQPYQNYTIESLNKDIEAIIKIEMSIRDAAEQFASIKKF